MAQNCWEFKKCGRQPGGARVAELGVCPAAVESRTDQLNHGKNGGRCCWVIAGTLCKGEKQGTFAAKLGACMQCDFFQQVGKEEGKDAAKSRDVLVRLTTRV